MTSILPRIKDKHIAIIGAGLAGLSCGSALMKAGAKVSLFEKSRGVAGRMSTRKWENWQCDHGARYFTARDPAFQVQLGEWLKCGVAEPWTTPIGVYENQQWRVSGSSDIRYVGTPWMTSPAQSLAVETRHTVKQVAYSEAQWIIQTAEHGQLECRPDWLVLATPAPQAMQLTQGIYPEIMRLNQHSQTQGCWTMMLRFAHAISMPFEAAFINDGILSWVARNNAKPQRSGSEVWVIHGQAQWSQDHVDDDPLLIAPQMIEAFIALGGEAPVDYFIHRWRYASSDVQFQPKFHCDFNQQIGFCGDWLYGGRVEGAWLSGHHLANAIISAK